MPESPERMPTWLLKHWQYRFKHEKLTAGRPREIDHGEVYDYARDIEAALRKLPKRVLMRILDAHSAEETAEAICSLPHQGHRGSMSYRQIAKCGRCLLLGGWEHRNATWPRLVPPKENEPPRIVPAKIENRTLPELLFLAITELGATKDDLQRVADSVACPALYDDVCTPQTMRPGSRAQARIRKSRSLAESRAICRKERRRIKNRSDSKLKNK
jgi:hypothetical protein